MQHDESDSEELAKRCIRFMEGTKRLYDGPMKGDMWMFELYHHLSDCAAALRKTTSESVQ